MVGQGRGGLDLPPAAAAAASLNPCDEEIGAEDEETRSRAAAAEYRALVFCCSTTLALLGSDPHLSDAPARPALPIDVLRYAMRALPIPTLHLSLYVCLVHAMDLIDLFHAGGSNSLFRILQSRHRVKLF